MKVKICYKVEEIKKYLEAEGYVFAKIPVVEEDEDWPNKSYDAYYFAKPEVLSIRYWLSFGTTASINLIDGSFIRAYGSNIKSNDKSVVDLNNNDWISPKLTFNGEYVESTCVVLQWLLDHGISDKELESCSKEFHLYDTIVYNGVPTPQKSNGSWVYSSEPLVLDEREIETILNDIEDELLRRKVKCILYARVFNKRN